MLVPPPVTIEFLPSNHCDAERTFRDRNRLMLDRIPPRRWFRVQSIGTVIRPGQPADPAAFIDPWQEVTLVIDERWADGLAELEGFSHLVVIFYLDRATRRRSSGPRRAAEDQTGALPVGFFSTRTPKRPNPIGMSCPRLLRHDGCRLVVTGIDAWDGTPILDIKGYYPRDETRVDATVPDWLAQLWASHDRDRGPRPAP